MARPKKTETPDKTMAEAEKAFLPGMIAAHEGPEFDNTAPSEDANYTYVYVLMQGHLPIYAFHTRGDVEAFLPEFASMGHNLVSGNFSIRRFPAATSGDPIKQFACKEFI